MSSLACRMWLLWSVLAGLIWAAEPQPAQAQGEPIRIKVVGGLAGIPQYTRHEAPFWLERVPRLTGGRVQAEIAPFDGSGMRPHEMLHLMRLGVIGFGTVLLSVAAPDDPELNAADLPGLNPDIERLRVHTAAYRPRLAAILADRYDSELLAIYTYPAQVLFCTGAFSGLTDMAGRRVRTSSVAQADLMEALGARPIIIPFAQIVPAIRGGLVDCAITGTLSGFAI
ncbi:MAG: hypothetical protein NZN45_11585, partial [Rhodovarius sp.]|nr:hypothetical protein [Rhodovarius sp.]